MAAWIRCRCTFSGNRARFEAVMMALEVTAVCWSSGGQPAWVAQVPKTLDFDRNGIFK